MFDFPDGDILYDALLARDPGWGGRAWVAVTSTGIFFRLNCPARKPRRENCIFHDSVTACLEGGFRPCTRCRPLATGGRNRLWRTCLQHWTPIQTGGGERPI